MKIKLIKLITKSSLIVNFVALLWAVTFIFILKGCDCEQISEHEIVLTSSTYCTFCMCPEGENEHGRWGSPEKIDLFYKAVSENEKYVSFGLIADTHIDAMTCRDGNTEICGDGDYYNNSEHMRNIRKVVKDLNLDCKTTGAPHVEHDCLGIIHLGDMTNDHNVNTQQILAFRQLFEYNYSNSGVYTWDCDCGTRCNDAYSQGVRINTPVIPMLGNHDVASNSDNETSRTVGYIIQRVSNANGILAQYPSHAPTNFIWRWGQYVFVTLGLHASSYNWEAMNETDIDKIEWLKTSLKQIVGDKNLGVLIFQHYG
ncbi:MAG: metallophosphoesterase [Ignavibacteriales bacterium]|nr:metallophosphoesterase [Ignavibacteriales bacterium]